jgi:hypothetical protein
MTLKWKTRKQIKIASHLQRWGYNEIIFSFPLIPPYLEYGWYFLLQKDRSFMWTPLTVLLKYLEAVFFKSQGK